jgi:predicted DNA-binding protein (MmcQ/YjbR family)
MNGTTLLKTAADHAEELPGAGLEHPFGPDWEVFKVRGRVFTLMTEVPGRPVVMNKKHWITLEGGDAIGEELVKELVTESYRLVVGRLPKSQQPVDPHTYGRRA